MRRLRLAVALGLAVLAAPATAQGGTVLPLYPAGTVTPLGVPEIRERQPQTGELMVRNVSVPTLELFRPAHPNGTAVIVAPGGGFVGLGYDHGGTAIAQRLAGLAVTALVLKYRTILSPADGTQLPEAHRREMEAIMARAKTGAPALIPPFAGEPHAVEDGARALAIVRAHAAAWGVDAHRVGMIGLSAGAFLAVDLAIGDKAARPDFVALLYGGLRAPVPADAPPAFIAAAADDDYLPDDSPRIYAAWRSAGAPAELHVYERGGHGFDTTPQGATSDHWFDEMVWWMQARGLIGAVGMGKR